MSSTPPRPLSETDSVDSSVHFMDDYAHINDNKKVSPPPVREPYDPSQALEDISGLAYALDLFLQGRMIESEEYCHKSDEKKERMYFATGFGLIQCVKALMSFDDQDIQTAIGHTKRGTLAAEHHRKAAPFLATRLAGYVVPALHTSGPAWIKDMTQVERHAELTYAESLFEKALLGIVYSGDWLAFVREALNMRTIINIYRQLYKFIEVSDAEYQTSHPGELEDPDIDEDFRSGAYLGMGMSSLILSLIPKAFLKVVELFGYKFGRREEALAILMRAGNWGKDKKVKPVMEGGIRRVICVDITIAARIVQLYVGDINRRGRYADGPFFLTAAGRLALMRSQPVLCIMYNKRAMEVQTQYKTLHYISWWEIAIASFAIWDIPGSEAAWRELKAGGTWSPSMYTYGLAVCLLQQDKQEEAKKLMDTVAELRQKIAGKSIPLEKFVARKSRRFGINGGWLTLPILEIAYVFSGIAHAPRSIVKDAMLPEVVSFLGTLQLDEKHNETNGNKNSKYKRLSDRKRQGYWDDVCLAMFLKAVCLRYIAYPDLDAVVDTPEIDKEGAIDTNAGEAITAFEKVLEYGPKIELDHHLVYHAHYELGRLLCCMGKDDEGRRHFDLVLSGKPLEVNSSGRKGKYSLENALMMRTHAAVEVLDKKKQL